jgi:hypothetical protein
MCEDVLVEGGITFQMYQLKSKFMNSEESIYLIRKKKIADNNCSWFIVK